ncbi:hypothetical protein CDIK_0447 [Cucumispora dikerogammari]|nr:hypothetical protein CDIK_0447 [Cucumispora dikerogammari]
MSLVKIVFNKIFLTLYYNEDTFQSLMYEERGNIMAEELMTSDNLNFLKKNIDFEKIRLEDFKLQPDKKGNSILVSTFELKTEDGDSIKPSFEELLDFNSLKTSRNKILPEEYDFSCTCKFKETRNLYIKDGYYISGCRFIFRKTKTDKLYLYLLFRLCYIEAINLNEAGLTICKDAVDFFQVQFEKWKLFCPITFLATQGGKVEEYTLCFPEGYKEISFLIKVLDNGKFSLSDNNFDNKYIIVKPCGGDQEGTLLKQNTIKESKTVDLNDKARTVEKTVNLNNKSKSKNKTPVLKEKPKIGDGVELNKSTKVETEKSILKKKLFAL